MIRNLIGSDWQMPADGAVSLPVFNPATGEVIEQVPLSGAQEVDAAVKAASGAFASWSRTAVMERVRLMFRYKAVLEEHFEELASIVTRHHGKTLDESRGEVRRGIEVVDFACGAPTLLQGRTLRDVSGGVDQDLYRYPVGVCAGIPPFNFPVMIPLWMFPLAVVAGNTFVLKPSERTPLGGQRLAELFLEAGFPAGVLNVVHGAAGAVDALLENPGVSAISFVGSAPVAKHVYTEAAARGKRVQALGGAKNHIVVMPDADPEITVPAILNSAFGNAGERCLSGSVAVAVGKAADILLDPLRDAASKMVVGPGDQPGVQVGPLIRAEHRDRVASYVEKGTAEGAQLVVDGRGEMSRQGFFLGPTILDRVTPQMAVGREEIFGPVLSVARAATLEDAIAQANASSLGNMATIFTQSGRAGREFRERVEAGMTGINVPIAQPFAFFPFSGWKGSFFGDLHVHGTDGIEFYTRKKVVVTRW
ncbi:MAG: CoA-acylating methylmalonate-semialdehyde dehydrogenase [Chloroflexi bacterium]|nr:MAG: methylmalonate-semialdehyde dehydrogenase (acylating) [Actinobacteria bacterium 13_2_20CM_2_66_6]TMF76237.1 MAG: CoA-acylating methylmalonate-semialdehyde dehydrogenase [Chloroflexota bacterium]TMG46022.1 MAG: CoA-acylating methylmalonate-semialdehyde dehydrogenase [Chloroflexota bacterium]